MIADAVGETDIHDRLVDEPWERARQLVTTSVEPLNLVVGAKRLDEPPAAH